MTDAVFRQDWSDEEFEAWVLEDLRGVSGGKAGNETLALAEGEVRGFDLDDLRARYKKARPKKKLGGEQTGIKEPLPAEVMEKLKAGDDWHELLGICKAASLSLEDAERVAVAAGWPQGGMAEWWDEAPAEAKKISPEPQPGVEEKVTEAQAARARVEPEPAQLPQVIAPAAVALEQVELINAKHAVIGNYGGKCAVLSWEPWDINPKYLKPVFQSFGDFRNRYLNRYVTIESDEGVSRVSAGKYWLQHPRRLNYDGVGFDPDAPPVLAGNRLNLWRQLAVEPRKGSWRLLRRHIYRVLGGGDRKAGRYIVRWLAWTFQNLGSPAETVLVFQGDEGAGKGIVVRALLKIFGPYALPISDPKNLIGAFSGHLHHCIFLFIDEAFWAGNVQAEGRLKSLITEETITIEPKYFAPFQAMNMLHMVMSSNSDWVVPAGPTARRYAVFKVAKDRIGDWEYFEALKAEMDSGGIAAMLYDLQRLDLKGWHPRELYRTAALVEQKQHSLRGLDAWIESLLQAGRMPVVCSSKYPNRCLSKDLLADAMGYDKFTNGTLIANKLKDLLGVAEFNNKIARGWAFPPLAECRKAWEHRNGGAWRWHHDVDEWEK